ncbi:MAG: PqqD family protein [Candidatus Loosdrechtia sp.]|uniref:PqqD family protein n=1 Tax=Candidatus Loosdrechtia sp. TaxID=3101272 RepID=UPI003A647225|nr:MAG: PqqD family protein [Candidatus Jettenia sp. AMX2]
MLELNQRVKPDPDVVITELEDKEAVLLHLGTKMYFTLNETGLRIWQMLNSGLTPEEVIERFLSEFDVSPEKARESILNLVNELIREKLVKVL